MAIFYVEAIINPYISLLLGYHCNTEIWKKNWNILYCSVTNNVNDEVYLDLAVGLKGMA